MNKKTNKKTLYFAWLTFQRRQVSMADEFEYENVFLPLRWRSSKALKTLSYLRNILIMFKYLVTQRPKRVWVQLPQTFLLWPVLFYKLFVKIDVIADCHYAMFRGRWSKVPLGLNLLKYVDVVVVHNELEREAAEKSGVPLSLIVVLEDAPASFEILNNGCSLPTVARPWVLFPGSFAEDEPVSELLDVAKKMPDVQFFMTGSLEKAKKVIDIQRVPENFHLMGFMPMKDFDELLCSSNIILALTKFDGIQLSVCNEAVGAEKAMVLSNTSLLKTLFPQGTVFVDPLSVESIQKGIEVALTKQYELEKQMKCFHQVRWDTWRIQANSIKKHFAKL
jgi:hypothetical protein